MAKKIVLATITTTFLFMFIGGLVLQPSDSPKLEIVAEARTITEQAVEDKESEAVESKRQQRKRPHTERIGFMFGGGLLNWK